MRVTTQMVANAAAKNGITFKQTTLLDMLNNNTQISDIFENLNKSQSASTLLKKDQYTKLEDASDNLAKYAEQLAISEENSVFSKAEKSGDTEEITTLISKLAEEYNTVIKQLKNAGGTLNSFYQKQLTSLAEEHETELTQIGITLQEDGSMSVDEEKLKNTDLAALKKAVGSDSDFSAMLYFISGKVAENASANLASVSSQYASNGTAYTNSFEASKYNFWG